MGGIGIREHRAQHAAHAGVRVLGLRPAPPRHPLLVLRLRGHRAHRLHVGVRVRSAPVGHQLRSRRGDRSGSLDRPPVPPDPRARRVAAGVPCRDSVAEQHLHRAHEEHVDRGRIQRCRGDEHPAQAPERGCPRDVSAADRDRAGLSHPDACTQLRASIGSSGGSRRGRDGLALRRTRTAGSPPRAHRQRDQRGRARRARCRDPAPAGGDRPVPRDLLGTVHARRSAADPVARTWCDAPRQRRRSRARARARGRSWRRVDCRSDRGYEGEAARSSSSSGHCRWCC